MFKRNALFINNIKKDRAPMIVSNQRLSILLGRINQPWLKKLLDTTMPHRCVGCGLLSQQPHGLCTSCSSLLPWLARVCEYCAIPLQANSLTPYCGQCLKQRPIFQNSYMLFEYAKPISTYILALKFSQQIHYAELFGELFAQKIQSEWYANKPLPQVIMPVPLHPQRLAQRGYNQAIEIAKPIAKKLQLPLGRHYCQRTKATLAQANIDADQRKDNVKNAFTVKQQLPYQHIAILDDVYTTGCTVTALSKALFKAGIKKIDIWSIARSIVK